MKKDSRFILKEKIAQGSFGNVYRGSYMEHDSCAIKKIQIPHNSDTLLRYSDSEWKILQKIRQKNIISIYGVCKSKNYYYIAMEYCDGRDLATLLEHCNYINIALARKWLKELIKALDYLKDMKVIHRDIKPSNILLTSKKIDEAEVKLVDFGLATMIGESLRFTKAGTPLYMAPEIFSEKGYNNKADVWSLGLVLYEMLYGSHPYKVSNLRELKECQKQPILYQENENVSEEAIELMNYMIQYNPDDRLDFEDLLCLPFFRETKFDSVSSINGKVAGTSQESEKNNEFSSFEILGKEGSNEAEEKNEVLPHIEEHVVENNIPEQKFLENTENFIYFDYDIDIKEVYGKIYDLKNRAELLYFHLKHDANLKVELPYVFGCLANYIAYECDLITEELEILKYHLTEDIYILQIEEVSEFINQMKLVSTESLEEFKEEENKLTRKGIEDELKKFLITINEEFKKNLYSETILYRGFVIHCIEFYCQNNEEIKNILNEMLQKPPVT